MIKTIVQTATSFIERVQMKGSESSGFWFCLMYEEKQVTSIKGLVGLMKMR